MNPNIANEIKTGPRTPEGKAISRLNALKTGEYSKLLKGVECNYCKRKEKCEYFKEDAKCSVQGKIVDSIFTNYLDVFNESKRLYKLFLSKALFELEFESASADKWFELARRQLQLMITSAPRINLLEAQTNYSMKKEIENDLKLARAEEKLRHSKEDNKLPLSIF